MLLYKVVLNRVNLSGVQSTEYTRIVEVDHRSQVRIAKQVEFESIVTSQAQQKLDARCDLC